MLKFSMVQANQEKLSEGETVCTNKSYWVQKFCENKFFFVIVVFFLINFLFILSHFSEEKEFDHQN